MSGDGEIRAGGQVVQRARVERRPVAAAAVSGFGVRPYPLGAHHHVRGAAHDTALRGAVALHFEAEGVAGAEPGMPRQHDHAAGPRLLHPRIEPSAGAMDVLRHAGPFLLSGGTLALMGAGLRLCFLSFSSSCFCSFDGPDVLPAGVRAGQSRMHALEPLAEIVIGEFTDDHLRLQKPVVPLLEPCVVKFLCGSFFFRGSGSPRRMAP
ncbi:hypothetical protein [Nonomuraea candida]|uniref:hypothetical protein n=1 Tax=Nonomuraea candida TaxID=359159 RepID=UPI0012FC2F3B|nr:hypothetical protein [Nonomuraea candida]